METILYYILVYFFEALVLWQYCSGILHAKRSKLVAIGSAIGLYTIPFACAFLESVSINFISFMLVNFVYILLLYKASWYIALFNAAITTVMMGLTELITMSLFSELTYTFFQEEIALQNFAILTSCSKLLYFVFLLVISRFFGKNKTSYTKKSLGTILLSLLSLATGFTLVTFAIISIGTELSPSLDRMIGISAFFLLIINIAIFGIYDHNQKQHQEYTELQIQYQKEMDSSEYYRMLSEQHENHSILIHDIKKHLNSLSLFCQEGDLNAIQTYVNQIISSSDLRTSVRVSDNKILNAILSRYIRMCQDKGIDFRPDIRSGSLDFVQEVDLTSIICNIMDNAFESASKMDHSYIEISITRNEPTALSLITLTNSCRVNPFSPETGKLHTSKKDKLHHGYGLKSVQRIVSKYHGEMKVYYNQEDYTFHTIITLKKPQE